MDTIIFTHPPISNPCHVCGQLNTNSSTDACSLACNWVLEQQWYKDLIQDNKLYWEALYNISELDHDNFHYPEAQMEIIAKQALRRGKLK